MKMKKEKKITKNHFYLPLIYTKKNNNNFLCSGNRHSIQCSIISPKIMSLARNCSVSVRCSEFVWNFFRFFLSVFWKNIQYSLCALSVCGVLWKNGGDFSSWSSALNFTSATILPQWKRPRPILLSGARIFRRKPTMARWMRRRWCVMHAYIRAKVARAHHYHRHSACRKTTVLLRFLVFAV